MDNLIFLRTNDINVELNENIIDSFFQKELTENDQNIVAEAFFAKMNAQSPKK